ncbi:unnamed product [Ostreococcus tauri]|uniref:Unnamed product n=1 Tax=Ostreococcus tauri TaxID=70448 RepID=A0A096PBJ4_OSTTA|nr:unnamed product [Ostreococcus tauri]CEG01988.1 unnamed product [Ostreococcus tauri]|eukprot:XP_022841290.1 unnamed product [Ostreococcus tauri]
MASEASTKMYRIGEGPYALNEDDSAVDPVAFREALMNDAEKLKHIERDEELAKALLGEDTGTMQEALKKVMAIAKQQREQDDHSDMNSTDIMRARCTVPRDPTVLYQGMLKAGLQYGPSFRLLSQVWIPEALDKEQRAGGGLGAGE